MIQSNIHNHDTCENTFPLCTYLPRSRHRFVDHQLLCMVLAQTYLVCFGSHSFLFFYVGVLFPLSFSRYQLAVLTQRSSDSHAVCYKNFQLFFRFIQDFLDH